MAGVMLKASQLARGDNPQSGWPENLYSNRETKKEPRFRGVVVLHGALDAVQVVLVILCAPFIGVLDCEIPVVCLFSGCPPAELFRLPVFLVRPPPPSTRGL
jgi:hypothetical protein